MEKLDKKFISILLMFVILFSNCSFLTSFATTDSKDEITINTELAEVLRYYGYDKNGDGKFTREELEQVAILSLTEKAVNNTDKRPTITSADSYSDLKYLTNLESLYLDSYSHKELDVSALSNLKVFKIENVNLKEDLPNIKVSSNLWIYAMQKSGKNSNNEDYAEGEGRIASVDLRQIKGDMYVSETRRLPISQAYKIDDSGIKSSDTSIISYNSKQDENENYYYFTAKKAGKATITLTSGNLCTRNIEMTVKENSTNPNIGLKNNCDAASLYYDAVLTESGNLYKINNTNPKESMQKLDSNVSKYVYCTKHVSAYLVGNTATLLLYKDTNLNNFEKTTINDVKDISKLGVYLKSNGDLCSMSYDEDAGKLQTKTVATGVTKLSDAFYIKNNETYYIPNNLNTIQSSKVANSAFTEEFGIYYALGNNLYKVNTKYENGNMICSSELVNDKFSKFVYDVFLEPVKIELTDGKTQYFDPYNNGDNVAEVRKGTKEWSLSNKYVLKGDKNLYYDDKLVLTNVKGMEKLKDGILVLRTDGSAYYQENPYTGWICVLENTKTVTNKTEEKQNVNQTVTPPAEVNKIANLVFDYKFYADLYPDLRNVFGYDENQLRNHWLTCGIKEGRIASPVFDAKYYLSTYSDLKNAFGDNYEAAYNHFITNGINEGRKASKFFDVKYYLNTYSDLKNAFGTDYKKALNHFNAFGMKEGRDGSDTFKISVYKASYSDLRKAFGTDNLKYYVHYITNGEHEGRKAN
jgi:hypothetical protein